MRVRQVLTAFVVASAVSLAVGGVAGAQTSTTQPAQHKTWCEKAEARLPKLDTRRTNLEARIDKLNTAIANARAAHHEDVVERLTVQLHKTQGTHDHIVDLINKIHTTCTPSA